MNPAGRRPADSGLGIESGEFLLAAVQILPSSEATQFSERAAYNRPRNIYEAASVALQPPDQNQPFGETRTASIFADGF